MSVLSLHLTQRPTASLSAARDDSGEGSAPSSLTCRLYDAPANQLGGCYEVGVSVCAALLSGSIGAVSMPSTESVRIGDPAPARPRLWGALRSGTSELTPIIG